MEFKYDGRSLSDTPIFFCYATSSSNFLAHNAKHNNAYNANAVDVRSNLMALFTQSANTKQEPPR